MPKFTGRLGIAVSVMLVAGVAVGTSPTQARDDVVMLSISDGLSLPDAQAKLDGSVKFYFGNSSHPAVIKSLGDYIANEKTNSLGKSSVKACGWAFLSALLSFQARAKELGANAVINIHSYYKREDVSSETQVQCHSGFMVTGVALKGDFVRTGAR